jgi:hypothetical protein
VQIVRRLKVESFYWVAIVFSNTLGTAVGDFLADDSGLGFFGGALPTWMAANVRPFTRPRDKPKRGGAASRFKYGREAQDKGAAMPRRARHELG